MIQGIFSASKVPMARSELAGTLGGARVWGFELECGNIVITTVIVPGGVPAGTLKGFQLRQFNGEATYRLVSRGKGTDTVWHTSKDE
jgi:hypothetical protein